MNLQQLVSWHFAGRCAPWASPRFSSELFFLLFLFFFFESAKGELTTTVRQTMNEEMTKSEEQHLSLQKALQQCELVQNMIDISISSLEGLRTKCATSNDLTQKEIRTLEVSGTTEILLCIFIYIHKEGGHRVSFISRPPCIFFPPINRFWCRCCRCINVHTSPGEARCYLFCAVP